MNSLAKNSKVKSNSVASASEEKWSGKPALFGLAEKLSKLGERGEQRERAATVSLAKAERLGDGGGGVSRMSLTSFDQALKQQVLPPPPSALLNLEFDRHILRIPKKQAQGTYIMKKFTPLTYPHLYRSLEDSAAKKRKTNFSVS